MHIRPITRADANAVAALHATSWQGAYRGILSDEYLDQRAPAERARYWNEQLAAGSAPHFGLLAVDDHDTPIGFAFVVIDDDPVHGNLLDNLHVLPHAQGRGVGRALMSAIAGELATRGARPTLFLWVYEENRAARAFYDRMRGTPMDRTMVTTLDGRRAWQWRYSWTDTGALRSPVRHIRSEPSNPEPGAAVQRSDQE